MSDDEPERTTKYVRGTFTVIFHGDYVEAGDAPAHLDGWLDAGLEDRDDLYGWRFTVNEVQEVTGDPEGFDV